MLSFLSLSFFVLFGSFVGVSADDNDCTPRTPANVTLRDLDGDWYIKVFINESDVEELRTCIKVTYTYNAENDTSREARSSIPHGSRNVVDEHVYIAMIDGAVDDSAVINGVTTTVHEVVTNIVKDDYMVLTLCKKEEGVKKSDRLALYVRDRGMGAIRIHQILRSIGIRGDAHSYFYPRQTNCPN